MSEVFESELRKPEKERTALRSTLPFDSRTQSPSDEDVVKKRERSTKNGEVKRG